MPRKIQLPDEAPEAPPAIVLAGHVPDTAESPPDDVPRGPEAPVVERAPPPPDPFAAIVPWFASLRTPPKPELVMPYAILLVMAAIARGKPGGVVKTDDLFAVAPRAAVEEALRRLRYAGHITLGGGGGEYTIARLPVELPR